jgi:seryl-tRNA synthetase
MECKDEGHGKLLERIIQLEEDNEKLSSMVDDVEKKRREMRKALIKFVEKSDAKIRTSFDNFEALMERAEERLSELLTEFRHKI